MNRTFYRILWAAVAAVIATAGWSMVAGAQQAAQQIRTPKQMRLPQNPDFSKLDPEMLPVQGDVFLIAGAGANIAVQRGPEGVLLVDTGYEQMSGKVIAAIR